MLLERDEGTLAALAVSPFSPGAYLATRTVTLTALGAVETIAVVWIAFNVPGSWLLILAGSAALGVIYTGLGAAVGARYTSVNALLLPASLVVTLLLLPLIPHFGLASASAVPDPSDRTAPFVAPSRIRRRESWRTSLRSDRFAFLERRRFHMGTEPREPVDA